VKAHHAGAVQQALSSAKGMSWDECHKIYVLMDDHQVAHMAELGYAVMAPDFDVLSKWFDESCSLRFVSAVRTVDGDPNEGFSNLIAQFE